MKSRIVDKLIERVDQVGSNEVQNFLNRLAEESDFFKSIFDALQEGVIVATKAGLIHYINIGASRLFGIDSKSIKGEYVADHIQGLEWENLTTGTNDAISRDLELFYPENKYLNFYIKPIVPGSEDTEPIFLMLIRDITESRKGEEEKIESERIGALTMLAAGVAHEIGNPLNSINIHLQLLERKLKKAVPDLYEAELRDLVETSTDEVKRLDHIVDQFLKAIRPSKPQLEPTDVNELLKESMRFLEPEIKDRGLNLTLELRSALPALELDPDQIKQAFYNIVKNATQATTEGGMITIKTDLTDSHILVTFNDTGEGISAENLSNVFQPYFTTKKSGTGLGLLIIRRIVREHGGDIKISSELGSGTSLCLSLPRQQRNVRFLPLEDKNESAK
ncbi:MAG: PAS domain-containing sensor histidine kinase [Verrucomicrobiales bacterium]|nr:PAS domain-containing sensor histidine kinase [Verrucomicrobiales bacterium]MBD29179.1 PAS domain-containing sensor histidine kinase [Verrucomicrobiaceae bacterium]MBV63988.1 PAS domain-containing sensor histidine kinase [Rickettsiales bacterium]|tara:strand:- start:2326 stop:3501 length:1176 start_codon:yes stop_codon:yes gene_type:complete